MAIVTRGDYLEGEKKDKRNKPSVEKGDNPRSYYLFL